MIKRIVLMLLVSALLFATSGCLLFVAGAAAGVGAGYAYANGVLKSTQPASLDRVWSASIDAMKDLEYQITKQTKDSLTGELVARTATDKKIELQLKKISDNSTEVSIRVGTFGDENLSRVVLDKIKKRL